MQDSLSDSTIIYPSTKNYWKSLLALTMVWGSLSLSWILKIKNCLSVTLLLLAAESVFVAPSSTSSLYPSSPYGNNNVYYISRYSGWASWIHCNSPDLFCTTISFSYCVDPMSPTIKTATSEYIGRLYLFSSVERLRINLIFKLSIILACILPFAILKVLTNGFDVSSMFFNQATISTSNWPVSSLLLKQ